MAQKDSHETSPGKYNNGGSKSVGHHCRMKRKHFAHMFLLRMTKKKREPKFNEITESGNFMSVYVY